MTDRSNKETEKLTKQKKERSLHSPKGEKFVLMKDWEWRRRKFSQVKEHLAAAWQAWKAG